MDFSRRLPKVIVEFKREMYLELLKNLRKGPPFGYALTI